MLQLAEKLAFDCVATWRVLFDRARSQLGAEATDLLVAMRASVDKLAYVFAWPLTALGGP